MEKRLYIAASDNADKEYKISVARFNKKMADFFVKIGIPDPSKEDVNKYVSLKAQGYRTDEMEANPKKFFAEAKVNYSSPSRSSKPKKIAA